MSDAETGDVLFAGMGGLQIDKMGKRQGRAGILDERRIVRYRLSDPQAAALPDLLPSSPVPR